MTTGGKRISYYLFPLFTIVICLLALTFGCSSNKPRQSTEAHGVEVKRGNLEISVKTSGHIEMPHQARVAFAIGGTAHRVYVELGDKVKKGQELAELESSSLERAVEQARTNLEDAWQNLSQAGSEARRLEVARNQLKRAQIAMDNARDNLSKATLLAPFDGEIANVMIKEGNQVAPGTVAFLLVDPSKVEVTAQIDEIDIAKAERGEEATITLDALPKRELRGKVVSISRAGQAVGGIMTYETKLAIEDPPSLLRSGMTCTACIITERKEDVLLVPTLAIRFEGGKSIVKVVGPDGKAKAKEVTIGAQSKEQTEIVEGLRKGDRVLIESVQKRRGFGF